MNALKNSKSQTAVLVKAAWENILQKKLVEENEHFFILGGDSLLASMLILSVSETLSIEIVLGDLYDHPTLKEFSDFIESRKQQVDS